MHVKWDGTQGLHAGPRTSSYFTWWKIHISFFDVELLRSLPVDAWVWVLFPGKLPWCTKMSSTAGSRVCIADRQDSPYYWAGLWGVCFSQVSEVCSRWSLRKMNNRLKIEGKNQVFILQINMNKSLQILVLFCKTNI